MRLQCVSLLCLASASFPTCIGLMRPLLSSAPFSKGKMLRTVMATVQRKEARVVVADAGPKGQGAFAAEPLAEGTFVGRYVGTLTTQEETMVRYNCTNPLSASLRADYLFNVDNTFSLDAQNSSHFSRFLNHAEHGNVVARVNAERRTIDFHAKRSIEVGEELTFDYGIHYWLYRPQPSPDSDSRNFSDPDLRELAVSMSRTLSGSLSAELSLLHPPPVGTVLPLIPLTAVELQAALALPEEESRAALFRCLDYFGSAVRTKDGDLELRHGVDAGADWQLLPADVCHSTLQHAAAECIIQAVLDPSDKTGALSHAFKLWLNITDAELALIRRWRQRVPRFASARADATALSAYLLWKNPGAHAVEHVLTRDRCNALIAVVSEWDGCVGSLEHVLAVLAKHAPKKHVTEMVIQLERWYVLGDGCTVVSHRPPRLEGAVPLHLSMIWDRVPKLVKCGLLSYDQSAGHWTPNPIK